MKHFLYTYLLLLSSALLAAWEYPGAVTELGPEEVVFQWAADSCEWDNTPDTPPRAYRDADETIHMTVGHYVSYRLSGADFNSLSLDCTDPVHDSHYNSSDPALHNDQEWLSSLYTEDGVTVHGIVHNEYHGNVSEGCEVADCLYTSLTYAVSTDSGRTFSHPNAPDHVVIAVDTATVGRRLGVIEPTNIIKHQGHYYFIAEASGYDGALERYPYLFRSADLSDPNAWRGWDGENFSVVLGNPYSEPVDYSAMQPLGKHTPWEGNIAYMHGSLTYNTYFNKFMLIGTTAKGDEWGIYYSLSDDLIHWSQRILIKDFPGESVGQGDPSASIWVDHIYYATLIDHDDSSRNFETADETAYLYYVRFHNLGSVGAANYPYARELVRIPIQFSKRMVDGFTVTRAGDSEDVYPGDGVAETSLGYASLRAVLMESRYRPHYYRDSLLTVNFQFTNTNHLISTLDPYLGPTFPILLDGSQGDDYVENSNAFGLGVNRQYHAEIDAQIVLEGAGSGIRGLKLGSLALNGDNMSVMASELGHITIDSTSDHTIGAQGNAHRNVIGWLDVANSANVQIENNYIGTDATGNATAGVMGNLVGIHSGATDTRLLGNLISGGNGHGIEVAGSATQEVTISGNLIGVTADGTGVLSNQNSGIKLHDHPGQVSITSNVIGGNQGEAGVLLMDTYGSVIQDNHIGLGASGENLGNLNSGIWVSGASSDNLIGGTNASGDAAGNTIANNGGVGVDLLVCTGTGNTISGNSLFANGGDGIGNLTHLSVPQAHLGVFSTRTGGDTLEILGYKAGIPSETYTIEFFMSDTPEGEGETFVGSSQYTAAGAPYAESFEVMFTGGIYSPEAYLTATLTDSQGSTGAFSSPCSGYGAGSGPVFSYTPGSLSFTYPEGISPIGTENISISVAGEHSGTLKATTPANWIIMEPDTLSIDPGNSQTMNITVDGRDVGAGTHRDTVWFHTNDIETPRWGLAIVMNIAMDPQNTPPVAVTQFHSAAPGGQVEFTLSGWDSDGDVLSFFMVSDPNHGSLSGLLPNFTYTADASFIGRDSLQFGVSDGLLADTASIHFSIAPPASMLLQGQVVLTNGTGPDDCPVIPGNRPYVDLVYEGCGEQTLGHVEAENMGSVLDYAPVTLRMGDFVMDVDSFACLDTIWGDYRLYAGGTAVIESLGDTLLYLEDVDLRSVQNFLTASMNGQATGTIVPELSHPAVVAELDPLDHGYLRVPFQAWNPIVQGTCGFYEFSFLLEPNMDPVENEAPLPFVLFSPEDQTLFHIQEDVGGSIDLEWESAEDPEGEDVTYLLEWWSDDFGVHEEYLEDEMFSFDIDSLLFHMTVAQVMETEMHWQVSASDGETVTLASNAPHAFTVRRHDLPGNSLLLEGQVVMTNGTGPDDCPVIPGNRPYMDLVYEGCGEQTLGWGLAETMETLDGAEDLTLRMGGFFMDVDSFACLDTIWGDYRLYAGGTAVIQRGDDTLLFVEDVELRSVQDFMHASMSGQAVGTINEALSDGEFLAEFDTHGTRRVLVPFNAWNPIVQGDCGYYDFSFLLQADTTSVVSLADERQAPESYILAQNYPNPFNPSTTIRYGLPEDAAVNLVIYDIRGNVVRSLASGQKAAGWHELIWNGRNDQGVPIGSGLYLTRFQAGDYQKVIKMMYLK
jgi:hypothetical protein